MGEITVDAATWARLLAGESVHLRHEGETRAVQLRQGPEPSLRERILAEWPSTEELDRRVREERSYTTEQVLDHLGRLHDGR